MKHLQDFSCWHMSLTPRDNYPSLSHLQDKDQECHPPLTCHPSLRKDNFAFHAFHHLRSARTLFWLLACITCNLLSQKINNRLVTKLAQILRQPTKSVTLKALLGLQCDRGSSVGPPSAGWRCGAPMGSVVLPRREWH